MPADRWQKRKDTTGLSASAKRAAIVAPAGAKTAQEGLVLPRNNEVFDAPVPTAIRTEVPAGERLVVSAVSDHSASVTQDLTCIVPCLESLEEGATTAPGAWPPPASRRAFYALLDGHGGGRGCAEWVARELPMLLARALRGVTESAGARSDHETHDHNRQPFNCS